MEMAMSRSLGYIAGSLLGGRCLNRLAGHHVVAVGLGAMALGTLPVLSGQLFDRMGPQSMTWIIMTSLTLDAVVLASLLYHSCKMPGASPRSVVCCGTGGSSPGRMGGTDGN